MKTIRKSFSARLSLQVVMIASMVFGVVFSVLFFSSKRIVRQEAESHAGSELSGTVYQIEDILHQVEAAANTARKKWGRGLWTISNTNLY